MAGAIELCPLPSNLPRIRTPLAGAGITVHLTLAAGDRKDFQRALKCPSGTRDFCFTWFPLSLWGTGEHQAPLGTGAKLLYRFENHVLDTGRRELRRGEELLAVEPQVFDLLVFLLRNRDRMVSKEDLITSVWDGRIVSDSTIASRINAVRRVIGDNGREQRLIRTGSRRGFRFVAQVEETESRENSQTRSLSSQAVDRYRPLVPDDKP